MTEHTGETFLYPHFGPDVDAEKQQKYLAAVERLFDLVEIHGKQCVQGFGPVWERLDDFTKSQGNGDDFVQWKDHPPSEAF